MGKRLHEKRREVVREGQQTGEKRRQTNKYKIYKMPQGIPLHSILKLKN